MENSDNTTMAEINSILQRAAACFQQGKLEEALAACEQAIELDPQNVAAHSNRGFLLKELGRMEEAMAACERAIKLDPDNAGLYSNYGFILRELGRIEESLAACERAVQLDPQHTVAHTNRAGALKGLGRLDEALAACERVIQLNPQNAGVYSNYGVALREMGRMNEALDAYNKAIQLNASFAGAHYRRGEVLKDMGRLSEAIDALKTALQHDPDLTDARCVLASMGAGEAPPQSPMQSTKELFDNYADQFDSKLLGELKYQTPQHMFDAVIPFVDNLQNKIDILDLGCGTGLCGVAFSDLANQMVGVDLAPRMLAKAKERGIYTDLLQGDVCQALQQCGMKFDLVLSGDVFVYIGKLDEVFALVRDHLNPGGLFAFSIEANETGKDYVIGATGRYAHSQGYIHRIAEASYFDVLTSSPVTLRYERGNPVSGCVIVLRLST